MKLTEAIRILNTFGKERTAAHRNNMDWMPCSASNQEMSQAFAVILRSPSGESRLTHAGRSLYEIVGQREHEAELFAVFAHGGARPGAGRPSSGRSRLVVYVTADEREAIYQAIPRLRKSPSAESSI